MDNFQQVLATIGFPIDFFGSMNILNCISINKINIMEFFKDGKYIIGFLVGVICSFVIMGGIKNYQDVDEVVLSDTQILDESQLISEEDENVQTNEGDESKFVNNFNEETGVSQNQGITKPEDPHSPELQRLALILRETERMMERLKKDMRSAEIKQQTANLLNSNQ